jgi:hypothetical protein
VWALAEPWFPEAAEPGLGKTPELGTDSGLRSVSEPESRALSLN